MELKVTEEELLSSFKEQCLPVAAEQLITGTDELIHFEVEGNYAASARTYSDGSILFEQIILPEHRPPFSRSDLYPISNDLGIYFANIDEYLEIEIQKNEKKYKLEKQKRKQLYLEASPIAESENAHTKAQYLLKKLGESCGVNVWIAKNDKHRSYEDEKLQDEEIHLPQYPISDEIKKRSELIDTIWFDEQNIVCAFEIECSTSVYSGLLRMADLMLSMHHVPMKFYIIAPIQREEKVLKEIRRPTFDYIGLSSKVKFIPLEMLEPLMEKISGLEGCITTQILEKIAIN